MINAEAGIKPIAGGLHRAPPYSRGAGFPDSLALRVSHTQLLFRTGYFIFPINLEFERVSWHHEQVD